MKWLLARARSRQREGKWSCSSKYKEAAEEEGLGKNPSCNYPLPESRKLLELPWLVSAPWGNEVKAGSIHEPRNPPSLGTRQPGGLLPADLTSV